MTTTNPSCLQTGASCRYADAEGDLHDALITAIVSAADRVVNLQYDAGRRRVANVRYSAEPARGRWGCADDGLRRRWSEAARLEA